MSELISKIKTYNDLLVFITNWRSVDDPDVYDFGGIVQLWIACMENMQEYAVEGELEDIAEYLDEKERRFIEEIAVLIRKSQE